MTKDWVGGLHEDGQATFDANTAPLHVSQYSVAHGICFFGLKFSLSKSLGESVVDKAAFGKAKKKPYSCRRYKRRVEHDNNERLRQCGVWTNEGCSGKIDETIYLVSVQSECVLSSGSHSVIRRL